MKHPPSNSGRPYEARIHVTKRVREGNGGTENRRKRYVFLGTFETAKEAAQVCDTYN